MSELGSIASGNPLYDLVRQGESGPAGYNAFNRGTHREHDRDVLNPIGNVRHEPITTSTCGEIENRQSLPTNDATRLGALGQYQIIAPTFERAEVDLQLRSSDVFDQHLQDRILSEASCGTRLTLRPTSKDGRAQPEKALKRVSRGSGRAFPILRAATS